MNDTKNELVTREDLLDEKPLTEAEMAAVAGACDGSVKNFK